MCCGLWYILLGVLWIEVCVVIGGVVYSSTYY